MGQNITTVDVVIFTDVTRVFSRYAGAYVVASRLRKEGYTVKVIDHFLFLGLDKTIKLIERYVGKNTRFVGWSTTFMNVTQEFIEHEGSFDFAEYAGENNIVDISILPRKIPISNREMDSIRGKIKSINPDTKLVMGGTKANFLNQYQIDAFLLGYTDNSIIEYIKYLDGENPELKFRMINENQMVLDTDLTAYGYDFQHSYLEFNADDFIGNNEVLPIEVSRGCIFQCKFCSFPLLGKKKNDHIKNKDVIYSEMMRNYERHGTTRYIFADDTYNESVQKLEYLAEAFTRLPFKIEYVSYVRHDLIHRYPEMADLLLESGLKVAMFGIETLNHEAGKLIGKGLHPDKTIELLHWLRYDKGWKDNVLTTSGFIVGLPTETRDTINAWAEKIIDFNFPLDTINFFPLFISNEKTRTSRSEFELNYAKYGYRFDTSISKGWINDHWQVEDAIELTRLLHNYVYDLGRTKTYGYYGMVLHNYGHKWYDIHNRSATELTYKNSIFSRNLEMAELYFAKHNI